MKIGNFGRLDPKLKKESITGLIHGSQLDEEIWKEFNSNWDSLAFENERLISKYLHKNIFDENNEVVMPLGKERKAIVKQRVNQTFFRKTVLASYNNSCCITGLSNSEMLIASHIKPWRYSNDNEKTNPSNGLCLNGLHDKAFDKGFITIDKKYTIHISNDISDVVNNNSVDMYFKYYDNKKIILPDKFMPNKEFLCYHNDVIYENWK